MALLYALLLVYGSLFPLKEWTIPQNNPFQTMLHNGLERASWSDLVTNLLIYMPLGFLLMRGLPVSRHSHWRRWLMTLLLGVLLSLVLEYLQAYLPGRIPSARDLLLNGVGTGVGALLAQLVTSGSWLEQRFRVLRATYLLPGAKADIGLLTLGFWALAQLAPLVPSLDLDNIRHGLKPLFLFLRYPSRFSWLQWGEYVTALTALGLLYAGLQRYRYLAISRFLSLAATVLLLKILVVSRQLSAEALLGLAAAAPLLLVMARTRAPSKSLMAIVLIVSAMLLETIQPNPGITTTTAINWIPFRGHLNNDVTGILDILGEAWPVLGLAYLSMRQFGTNRAVLLNGMLCVFFGTFAMEWMQCAIPGRSADITDVLVSTLAWLFAWIYVSTKNPTGLSASKPTGNGGDPLFKSHPTLLKVGLPALVVTASVGIFGSFWLQETTTRATAPSLEHLPPNRWIRLHQPKQSSWRRQNYAGIAYDSRRHSLLLFGSDTHRSNWDNSVHEFDIQTLTWKTHYPEAPPETYRVDSRGQPVAGGDRPLPWAMHTFDTIVYDPQQDALVVAARPLHNPMIKKVEGIRQHPTWIYDLTTHGWKVLENGNRPAPNFFAGALAYDSHRDVIVGYKYGIWELGPDRKQWKKATGETHHSLHFNMEYDSKRRQLVVFGDGKKFNEVWIYTPGAQAGERGFWEKKVPGGDPCPPDEHFPVAFDANQGLFLLVPHDEKRGISTTFVYDPDANAYTRIPNAEMKLRKMNYMMTWDPLYKVFLLVTGDWTEPATVWALKLDLDALPHRASP